MDDVELDQVVEKIHTIESNLNGIRNELKKLPPIKKTGNDVNLKTLQQLVAKSQKQQQRRT